METIKFEQFSPITTCDAGLWLRNFNRFCKMKGWTEEQITSAFPLFLTDNATLWYDAAPEETQKNLNNIKKSLLDRFVQNSISNWKENDMFFNKKQTEEQSVEDFTEEVH